MENQNSEIKYVMYARKSSESEDRQVQSIEDQIDRLDQLAKSYRLTVGQVYRESKSAKMPNNRPLFSEMLDMIEQGNANGILCWQINRLSRNPVDSGRIQWMLQKGLIKSIQTIDREYRPEDNVLLFSVESGMANQFIIDLRKNTMRGMESKLQKGWMPNLARLGYINDVINKTIVRDPERYDLVKQVWGLMLTGNYTVPQILRLITNEWKFTTVRRKNKGGTPLSYSGLYSLFHSKFYAGIIQWDGKEYVGVHEPMVTLEEYERVQEIMACKTGKPRPKRLEHSFTGVISCGECGASVTASTKFKQIKSTGENKRYDYYHCTHKRKYVECSQRKVVEEKELEKQIEQEILKVTILPEFRQWSLEILDEWNETEVAQRSKIQEMQSKVLLDVQAQLDSLTKMRIRELVSDEVYIKERDELQSKLVIAKQRLQETESRAEKWLELTEKTFDFACYAYTRFTKGDMQTKKEILTALGSSFTMKNCQLQIEINKWFEPVLTRYPELEKEYLRLEPTKHPINKERTEALASVRSLWGARRESDPRSRCHRAVLYH